MDNKYGGVIWTNHALQRSKERHIKQSDAWATWKRPERSRFDSKKGAWIYQRIIDDRLIEVVAKKNESKEWLILSLWSSPAATRRISKEPWLIRILKRLMKIE
jgi:hypothetical protein